MSAIRAKMIEYINEMPEYKLIPLEPLIEMLAHEEMMSIEKVAFDDLSDDEKQSLLEAEEDLKNGNLVSLEDIV